jgi:hypothetical protein
MMMYSALLGVLKTHSAQQGSAVIEWSWNTHDKYCDMLLTISTSNSQVGTAAWEYAIHYPTML